MAKEFSLEEALGPQSAKDGDGGAEEGFSLADAIIPPKESEAKTVARGMAEMRGYGRPAPEKSIAGTPVSPKGKSVFERVPLSDIPEPTVDAQKNLELMERSEVPESVMFTPWRTLQQIGRAHV